MPSLEILNARDHRHLRLRPRGNNDPHFVQIVASEFAAAAASCPILLSKDATTGSFYAGAMFGFKPGESTLSESADRGGFNPLNLQRDGFFISGEQIAIDRDNPRFSETEGAPLFDEALEPTIHLGEIQRALGRLKTGTEETNAFIRALVILKLVEAIDISLKFDAGELLKLQGLYTVSLDALRDLDDAAAIRLFRAGHLQLAYGMIASRQQIGRLAHLRNQRLAG